MQNIINAVLVLGVTGACFGALLAVASKIFYVPQDPRIDEVREFLAGANCGACGFPGCDGYAAAVVAGAAPNLCTPAGAAANAKIASVMGLDAKADVKCVARVACGGKLDTALPLFDYVGPQDCSAAMRFGNNGPKLCPASCIGMGSCVHACKFDALEVIDGVAVVDREKCVGCMACQSACPKGIIEKVPYHSPAHVRCSSKDKGPVVMKRCKVGCISCTKCVKTCEFDAIHMVEGIAVINYEKCTGCKKCIAACPRKIIEEVPVLEQVEV